MFKKIFVLVFFKLIYVKNLPIANLKVGIAEEVQNAICSINTKEIEATANATITRQLKGVCTSNELSLKLDDLQTKILQEIDGLRYMLEINGFKTSDVLNSNDTESSDYQDNTEVPVFASKRDFSRLEEILLYNDTLRNYDGERKYVYYWKIDDILQLLTKTDVYITSPKFHVLGHALHLLFHPNHLEKKYLGILLKPDSPGFLKKHKLVILNRLNADLDLKSETILGIGPEKNFFRIAYTLLRTEGFIIKNCIIIKLEIFLD